MKSQTSAMVMTVLSDRLHGMIAQLSKSPPSHLPGLTAGIDETSAALTDFARNQHETNTADVNAGIAAIGVLTDHEAELEELNKFFESGAGRGGRAHKMVRSLLKLVNDSKPETLAQPA